MHGMKNNFLMHRKIIKRDDILHNIIRGVMKYKILMAMD